MKYLGNNNNIITGYSSYLVVFSYMTNIGFKIIESL